MIKAIIIDDEKTSRITLTAMLNKHCKDVEVVAEADGCNSGIEAIKEYKPDVIFLDIQMPDGSGFKLLEDIGEINFEVIFSTAYDQFAIKAIKYSALDYLLKPINPEDLTASVVKLQQKLQKGKDYTGLKFLVDKVKSPEKDLKKIVLGNSDGIYVVDIDSIIRCESVDCYTKFFLADGRVIMVSKTLKEHDELLSDYSFLRTHKSHLINTKYVISYQRADGGRILMSDGTEVPCSRRKRDQIIDNLSHL